MLRFTVSVCRSPLSKTGLDRIGRCLQPLATSYVEQAPSIRFATLLLALRSAEKNVVEPHFKCPPLCSRRRQPGDDGFLPPVRTNRVPVRAVAGDGSIDSPEAGVGLRSCFCTMGITLP